MRIATWNCNMAFRRKKSQLLRCDTDVCVVQECENPETNGTWNEFSDWEWIGENDHKGLGIFCRDGIEIASVITRGGESRYVLHVELSNGRDVFGVWAMNDGTDPRRRYIGQVYTALKRHGGHVDSDSIVLGDFNWNVEWDESPRSPLYGNFSDTVDILKERGLHSVYHSVHGTDFGAEENPTFYMHKKEERPYHIDYVFTSDETIRSAADFRVGERANWIEHSDHTPLVLDVSDGVPKTPGPPSRR